MKRLAFLLLLAAPAAAQIHVPGDYPTLQDAIDGASPGDVIVCAGGPGTPVVVDKPLTILVENRLSLYAGCIQDGKADSAIRLEGPGSGKVVLANLILGSKDCNYPAPGISGGGFDELHVLDTTIEMESGFSGLGHGGHAIDVDVPFVLIANSDVHGIGSDSDHCLGMLHSEEFAGVRNPNGTVMVIDSTIRGGSGGATEFLCCIACPCPALPDDALGGQGGPGIIADQVLLANSTVLGGEGATFWSYPLGSPSSPIGTPTSCGKQDDGPEIVASALHVLGGTLSGASSASPGGTYVLGWDLPGPGAFLFFSPGATEPVPIGASFLVLEAATASFLGPIPTGSPQSLTVSLPAAPELLGIEFAFQAWDAGLGLTRPVVGVVQP
jgi:hypothetical protein